MTAAISWQQNRLIRRSVAPRARAWLHAILRLLGRTHGRNSVAPTLNRVDSLGHPWPCRASKQPRLAGGASLSANPADDPEYQELIASLTERQAVLLSLRSGVPMDRLAAPREWEYSRLIDALNRIIHEGHR